MEDRTGQDWKIIRITNKIQSSEYEIPIVYYSAYSRGSIRQVTDDNECSSAHVISHEQFNALPIRISHDFL